MYDFTLQMHMMRVALYLLDKHDIADVSALGGGTALAAFYWNHRYSTDIDIFTHADKDVTLLFRPLYWDKEFKKMLQDLKYKDHKAHPVYMELLFENNFKIQFFNVNDRTKKPYSRISLWDMDLLIESVEEIIAKKIYYRADKGNARDIFDIAIATHKNPVIFDHIIVPLEKIEKLLHTLRTIHNEEELLKEYLYEINLMNPNPIYRDIAHNAITYLETFIESYIGAKKLGIELESDELYEIEKYSYNEAIKKKSSISIFK